MYASASETSLHTSLRRSSVAVRILAAMAPNARIWVAVVFMVDTPSKVGMVRDLDQIAVTAQGRDPDHASDAENGNEHGANSDQARTRVAVQVRRVSIYCDSSLVQSRYECKDYLRGLSWHRLQLPPKTR